MDISKSINTPVIRQTNIFPAINPKFPSASIKTISLIDCWMKKAETSAKTIGNQSLNCLKGIAVWTGIQTILFKGLNIQILKDAATGKNSNFLLSRSDLKIFFDNLANSFPSAIPKTVDSNKILNSDCPIKEFYTQLSLLYNTTITQESSFIPGLLWLVVIPPIAEEIIFRELIQDSLLKKGVRWVVEKVSPKNASVVDSKIYTGCRILLASLAFSAVHNANRGLLPDSYVKGQLVNAFILGIASGILKETVGLSASIGAHGINNFVASIGLFTKC